MLAFQKPMFFKISGRISKKLNTSQLKYKSSFNLPILLCVFEGDITVDGKFSAFQLPGSITAVAHLAWAQLNNTVRTPTDKSVWGKWCWASNELSEGLDGR